MRLDDRPGGAEAVDADRNAAVDRDLGEHRAQLVGRETVAQSAADMALKLLHLAERRDHAEVEDRALARAQGVVAPRLAPAILGQDALKIAVEVVDIVEGAIDIFVAQHLAPLGQPAVVHRLIHGVSLRQNASWRQGRHDPPRSYTQGAYRVPISAKARRMVSAASGGKVRDIAAA